MELVDLDARLPVDALPLQPRVQKKNASLALAAGEAFLRSTSVIHEGMLSQEDIRKGVDQWEWPGRFQMLVDKNIMW